MSLFRTTLTSIAVLIALVSCEEKAASHDHDHETESSMVTAAKSLINSFEDKEGLLYEFQGENQFDWHLYPKPDRIGKRYGEMNEAQQAATRALLSTALSEVGKNEVAAIMQMEILLKSIEKRDSTDDFRNPGKYFISLFGEPSMTAPWGWRFEGHHVSLSVTVVGDKISVTPTALGAYPSRSPEDTEVVIEVLTKEQEQGRALAKSLDEAQLISAIAPGEAPEEILTGFGREIAEYETTHVLSATDMTEMQRAMLEQLVRLFVGKMETSIAEAQMQRMIDAGGLDALYFTWMGSLEPGKPHYYRIQGPTMILEYDNTQNNANHVHVVWRDPTNDFGEDYLKRHYETADADHGHTH
ncbi:MAG: DUF3500 domain-containing protein [Bacteroidia bacterium]|nr:DUF3500 domain-containing protein [Bacteroidia bacterium]